MPRGGRPLVNGEVDVRLVEGMHGLHRAVRERLVLADERPVDVREQEANHRSAR